MKSRTFIGAGMFAFQAVLFLAYSPENLLEFAIATYAFSILATCLAIIAYREELKRLSYESITYAAATGALIFAVSYVSMLLPSFIYFIVPFASALFFYLPASIVFGVDDKIASEESSPFDSMLAYGLVSKIFHPNVAWVPYYIALGALASLMPKNSISRSFAFGFFGASLAFCYMLISWGFYVPLFILIPSVLADSVASAAGYKLGLKIAEEVRCSQI